MQTSAKIEVVDECIFDPTERSMKKTIIAAVSALILLLPAAFCQANESKDHICFRTLDINQDGVVTMQEFEQHYGKNEGQFNAADANQDGKLTHDEYHISLGHGSS